MSEEISVASHVIKANPHLRNVDMIIRYAYKALFSENTKEPLNNMVQVSTNHRHSSGLWVLTAENREECRAVHTYAKVPRHQLATRILSLCDDVNRIG